MRKSVKPSRRRRRRKRPTLRLSPYAWAKLCYLRDAGPTEIGGFGLSSQEDPLRIEDVRLVRQEADWASVTLDDEGVADDFDRQVDLGIAPHRFARIWLHTHPGASPSPSGVDEVTFARVFGRCDWAVMMILAKGGASYARLQVTLGQRVQAPLKVLVDYEMAFPASDQRAWQAEYDTCVQRAWQRDPPADQLVGIREARLIPAAALQGGGQDDAYRF